MTADEVNNPDTGTYDETPLGTATLSAQRIGVGDLDTTKINRRIGMPNGFIHEKL